MWGLVGLQGVLYSHRSNFLHALMCATIDIQHLGSCSCFCALVPMFHANAWGLVFAAPLTGARLVLPGESALSIKPPVLVLVSLQVVVAVLVLCTCAYACALMRHA